MVVLNPDIKDVLAQALISDYLCQPVVLKANENPGCSGERNRAPACLSLSECLFIRKDPISEQCLCWCRRLGMEGTVRESTRTSSIPQFSGSSH
jgi:hypothetical protein